MSAAFLGASGELVEVDVTGYVAVGVGHGRRAGGEVFQHRMVPAHLCGQHVLELFAGIGGIMRCWKASPPPRRPWLTPTATWPVTSTSTSSPDAPKNAADNRNPPPREQQWTSGPLGSVAIRGAVFIEVCLDALPQLHHQLGGTARRERSRWLFAAVLGV